MSTSVDKQEIIKLVQDMIRCPSVNPPADTGDCAQVLLRTCKENGIDAQIIEGRKGACNVIARLPGSKKGKKLILNGHLDVVPTGSGWSVDPFSAEIKDNKIYGRGTCDMKGGVASALRAMIEFKRSGTDFDGEIMLMAVADEETGSEFGTAYLLKNKIGVDADFAIVAEPTNFRVELGNRGLRWADITVKGKATHAARPHLGINAIFHAAKAVEAIQSMTFTNRNNAFDIPHPSISVTMIKGGTKENSIPDLCSLTADRRMIPGETSETVMKELEQALAPVIAQEKGPQIDIKLRPNYWDPFLISEEEPIVKAVIDSYKQVAGINPEIGTKSACTDASHLFHIGGIPAVIFGPGNPLLSHGPDENIEIDQLVLSTEILISIFNKLLVSR